MGPMTEFTFEDRVACVDRELRIRRKTRARLVDQDRSQEDADRDIQCLESVRDAVVQAQAFEELARDLARQARVPEWRLEQMMRSAQDSVYLLISMGKKRFK